MTESENVHLEAMEPILERHAPDRRSNLLPTLFEVHAGFSSLKPQDCPSALAS